MTNRFKQIRDDFIRADKQAIDDWEDACMYRHPSVESRVSFIEFRRAMQSRVIHRILDTLIEQEEKLNERVCNETGA